MRAKIAEFKMLLAADKKQATILAGLLVFLLISSGRVLLNMSPSKASARDRSANKTSTQDTNEKSKDQQTQDAISLAALPDATRDIFALNSEKFPQPASTEQSAEVRPKSDAGNDEAHGAETLSEHELTRRRVLGETEGFRLKSTILGVSPIAVIDMPQKGKKTRSVVLGVGDMVDGFEVIEIRRQSVLIEKNGVRVELTG